MKSVEDGRRTGQRDKTSLVSVQVAAAFQTVKAPSIACSRLIVPIAYTVPLVPKAKAVAAAGFGGSSFLPAPTTEAPLMLNVPRRAAAASAMDTDEPMIERLRRAKSPATSQSASVGEEVGYMRKGPPKLPRVPEVKPIARAGE